MFRFILGSLWKAFALFFVIHILSHWSDVEAIFCVDETEEGSYYHNIVTNVCKFILESSKASLASLLELVNFAIFVSKRSVWYLKSKTYYDKYVMEQNI